MNVAFANSKKTQDVIGSVESTAEATVDGKPFVYHRAIVNGNPESVFHTAALKPGDRFTHEDATMTGPKGAFPALWTTEARSRIEGPLLASGLFKEGEDTNAKVKILDCQPRMKNGVQSFYESKFGPMYHYSVMFEHEGVAINSTFQGKEQGKSPFNKGDTVDVIVSVKNGYVNIKKVPKAPGGFGGGSSSKHDAWARVYSTHFMDARKTLDESKAKASAIAAANDVIKKMEV